MANDLATPVPDKPLEAPGSLKRDPWAEFERAAFPTGEAKEQDWSEFERVGASTAEKVETVGQSVTGGFVEAAPMVAGAVAGGKIGALGGPFAPITVPLGVAGGGLAGYVAGKEGRSILAETENPLSGRPVTNQGPESLDPELRPFAFAGEVIGESIPFAGLPFYAAQSGFRAGADGIGRFVNRIVDSAARAPVAVAQTEAAGISGAAFASGLSEAALPGNEVARTGAEIAGGFFNPTRLILKTSDSARNVTLKALSTVSDSARRTRAADTLKTALEEAGENPQALADMLRESDLPGMNLTSAQRTGSKTLAVIENTLVSDSKQLGAESQKAARDGLELIGNMIVALRGTGDPQALRAAANLRSKYFKTILSGRLSAAEARATETAANITQDTPEARQRISEAASEAVQTALDEARQAESELWARVPREVETSTTNVADAYNSVRAQLLPEEPLPNVVEGFVQRMGDQNNLTTSGELLRFRSRALALAREAQAAQKFNDARIYGVMAEAALEDLAQIGAGQGAAVDEARSFSRALNETFTRTFAGDAMATNKRGGARLPPEIMMQRALAAGKDAAALRMNELERATRFMTDLDMGSDRAIAASQAMIDAQQRMLRLAASEAVDPQTGRASSKRLSKFLRDNAAMMQRFPQVRNVVQEAIDGESGMQVMERMAQGGQTAIDRLAAFSKVAKFENPIDAVGAALRGANPVKDMRGFVKLARRGGDEALEGLRVATLDHALSRAQRGNGFSFDALRQELFGPIRPGQPSLADIMAKEGVMSREQFDQMDTLLQAAERIVRVAETGGRMDVLVDAPGQLADLLISIAGSNMASFSALGQMSGSGLIIAGRGAQTARNILQRQPRGRVRDVLVEAARNPEFMAKLIEEPRSAAARIENLRTLNAFAMQAGLIEEDKR